MKQALIFDLDGTLVESLPGIAASLNRALTGHGLPGHSHAAVRSFIGDGARTLVSRALKGVSRLDLVDSVLGNFSADYGLSWANGTFVYDGIQELLAELRAAGRPLAVLSNKPHAFTDEIVKKLFPDGTFQIVLGNREGLPHKPDPQGALEISQKLGIASGDCVVIGDSTMDLDTAQNAGMRSIAVTWGYHDRERLAAADGIVDSVTELREML